MNHHLETSAIGTLEKCSEQVERTARRSHKQHQQRRALPTMLPGCTCQSPTIPHMHPLLAYTLRNSPTPLERQTPKEPELYTGQCCPLNPPQAEQNWQGPGISCS